MTMKAMTTATIGVIQPVVGQSSSGVTMMYIMTARAVNLGGGENEEQAERIYRCSDTFVPTLLAYLLYPVGMGVLRILSLPDRYNV